MQLILQSQNIEDVAVVRCQGRIVAGAEADALRRELENLTRVRKKVVLQLADVGFIDSAGLGALVRLFGVLQSATVAASSFASCLPLFCRFFKPQTCLAYSTRTHRRTKRLKHSLSGRDLQKRRPGHLETESCASIPPAICWHTYTPC